jgi:hypothetical protein
MSTDAHISPIADIKDIIQRFLPNISVTDESVSGACQSVGTCATRLKGIPHDALAAMYATVETRLAFFEAYRDQSTAAFDDLVFRTDVAHCSHPTGMCEYYMPFNRSLILWATTRFEQGKEYHERKFRSFVDNFRAMALQPGNVVLANSVYDQHYIYYFTGIKPLYVPSLCAYPRTSYAWNGVTADPTARSATILLHGFRPSPTRGYVGNVEAFVAPLVEAARAHQLPYKFTPLRRFYTGRYDYADLAQHPAILHLPYQVSIMSLFEHYRMAIPIIAPSVRLLTEWQMTVGMVSERTWDMVLRGTIPSGSVIGRHPDASDVPFDPNDETNRDAVAYWLAMSDYHTFPHIILFDSWDHLAQLLKTVDFRDVSRRMAEENARLEKELAATWRRVFETVIPAGVRPSLADMGYEERMDAIYGKGKWHNYPQ